MPHAVARHFWVQATDLVVKILAKREIQWLLHKQTIDLQENLTNIQQQRHLPIVPAANPIVLARAYGH
jgi:hypothetical protein